MTRNVYLFKYDNIYGIGIRSSQITSFVGERDIDICFRYKRRSLISFLLFSISNSKHTLFIFVSIILLVGSNSKHQYSESDSIQEAFKESKLCHKEPSLMGGIGKKVINHVCFLNIVLISIRHEARITISITCLPKCTRLWHEEQPIRQIEPSREELRHWNPRFW